MAHGDDSGPGPAVQRGTDPAGDRADLPHRRGPRGGRRGRRDAREVARGCADGVWSAALQDRLARRVAGLQVQPLGAAWRSFPAGDRAARRRRRTGSAGPPRRSRQAADRARRACGGVAQAALPTTRRSCSSERSTSAPRTPISPTRTTNSRRVLDRGGRLPDGALVRRRRLREADQCRRRARPSGSSRSTRPTSPASAWSTASPPSAGCSSPEPTRHGVPARRPASARAVGHRLTRDSGGTLEPLCGPPRGRHGQEPRALRAKTRRMRAARALRVVRPPESIHRARSHD